MTDLNMSFFSQNLANTTTQFVVDSATSSVSNLIDRDTNTKWTSLGYTGSTATTITITPSNTPAIDTIYLQNVNLNKFSIYYNGTTTNTFVPDITSNSSTSQNMIFKFATQTVSSISIKMETTYPVGSEKHIGEIYIGSRFFSMSNNPAYDEYNPSIYRKGQDMEMSDGGMVSIFYDEKFRTSISMSYLTETERDLYRSLWDLHVPFMFIPFPKTYNYLLATKWDGSAYEVNWLGDFNAYRFSSNIIGNGYNLSMNIAETPR